MQNSNYSIVVECKRGDMGYKIIKHSNHFYSLYVLDEGKYEDYGIYDCLDDALICADIIMNPNYGKFM